MSLTEIFDALPGLSHVERRAVCRRVLEIEEEESAQIQFIEQASAENFAQLDRMEAEDAARGKKE